MIVMGFLLFSTYRDITKKENQLQQLAKTLQEKENVLENLHAKCRYLEEENHLLVQQTESLNDKVAKLQDEHEKYLKEITDIKSQNVQITNSMNNHLPLRKDLLPKMLGEVRQLYVANDQLRVLTTGGLSEIRLLIERLKNTVVSMPSSTKEIEEVRALYQRESLERKLLYNQLQELRGNIRVFCRCRLDDGKGGHLEFPTEEDIFVDQNGNKKRFRFDQVFLPQCTQVQYSQ